MNLLDIKGYAIAGVAAFVLGSAAGGWGAWEIQANKYEKQLSEKDTKYATDMKSVSDAATIAQSDQLKKFNDMVADNAANDAAKTKELNDAKAKNSTLNRQLATAAVRVRVPVVRTDPAGSNDVRSATGTAGVDDGAGTAELDPAFAAGLERITGDGDEEIIKLTGLQKYVTDSCLKK